MAEAAVDHHFQFSSARHQADAAVAGMWLFLASEVLFFGALFLSWTYARHWNPAGFGAAAQQTSLWIGTSNTVILLCSSFAYSIGLVYMRGANTRRMVQCFLVAIALGMVFLFLKFGIEWRDDFSRNFFPGAGFAFQGSLRGGAQLFFIFYFFATAVHGLHLIGGVILVSWIIARARRGDFSQAFYTPVVVVGLYWSFVDAVWLVLYPMIYLVGRA